MAKTIKIIFNCGPIGRVIWEAPRVLFKDEQPDKAVQEACSKGWGPTVTSLFGLMVVAGHGGLDALSTVMTEVDSYLQDCARRATRRAQP